MKNAIILLAVYGLMLVGAAGCTSQQWQNNPVAVIGDSSAAPADRIAAAEVLYNSATSILVIARQDKLIDDATWHSIRLASDSFVAAIGTLKAQAKAGLPLDGNALWASANAALTTLLTEKDKPHAGSTTRDSGGAGGV